ncbi:MAG TPA: ATP-binding cassette domain-containing protein [Desulfomonilaceae bacterium]|nr:ATP-binding cassette domain-containing protein [Desulfomonilaceae bacterium]
MESADALVELIDVSVRIGKAVILSQLNWKLRSNENWAVLGGNGAGKTTFLSLVRGDIWPAPEGGRRWYQLNGTRHEGPVGFREYTGTVSSELLDRYRTGGWNLTGTEVICTGFRGTLLLYEKPDKVKLDRAREMLALLGLDQLADRRLPTMSLGEAKKILIARAMVQKPRLLFLDEISAGLDRASKATVLGFIQRIAEQGTQIMCSAHDSEDIPIAVTHALTLRSGRIIKQGRISEVSFTSRKSKSKAKCTFDGALEQSLQVGRTDTNLTAKDGHTAPTIDRKNPPIPPFIKGGLGGISKAISLFPPVPTLNAIRYGLLIQIENADVYRDGKKILQQITWNMKPGQNWVVLGRNGSGKTTLLKLIVGDLRPLWGGTIKRFAPDNPSTIWEIRQQISLVTPDQQAGHISQQTGLDMVVSGFYWSVGLHQEPTQEQIAGARSWLQVLGGESLENREVHTLSYGQVRMLLITRAIVTAPKILLLDEPLSGLDSHAKHGVLAIIEKLIETGTSVIYVTHDDKELFTFFTHVAVLENGRMIFQGAKEQWDKRLTAAKDA